MLGFLVAKGAKRASLAIMRRGWEHAATLLKRSKDGCPFLAFAENRRQNRFCHKEAGGFVPEFLAAVLEVTRSFLPAWRVLLFMEVSEKQRLKSKNSSGAAPCL